MIRHPELIKFIMLKYFTHHYNYIGENKDLFFGKNFVVLRGNRRRKIKAWPIFQVGF